MWIKKNEIKLSYIFTSVVTLILVDLTIILVKVQFEYGTFSIGTVN